MGTGSQERTHAGRGASIFYGWYVVGACFIICFVVYGICVNTFTVYVKPLEAEFGWSRKLISAGVSIAALSAALAAPAVGRLIDRLGVRHVMVVGTLLAGGALVLLGWMHSLPAYYAIFVLSGIGQAASTLIPISVVVANWFEVKRGLALGIVMSGTGLGAMVMVPVTTLIVNGWGWRTSFLTMGLVIVLIAAPVILLLIHGKPSDLGLQPDGNEAGPSVRTTRAVVGLTLAEALRTRTFWLIAAMMFIFALVGLGMIVHLMPSLTDLGHSDTTASLLVAVVSAMTVCGKLGIGWFADRWGARRAVVFASALMVGALLLLVVARPLAVAVAFAVVYGFAVGAPMVINPTLTSEDLGLLHFGAIFGALTLIGTVGAALGPVVIGALYDAFQSYVPAYLVFAGLVSVAGLCGFQTHPTTVSSSRG